MAYPISMAKNVLALYGGGMLSKATLINIDSNNIYQYNKNMELCVYLINVLNTIDIWK